MAGIPTTNTSTTSTATPTRAKMITRKRLPESVKELPQ